MNRKLVSQAIAFSLPLIALIACVQPQESASQTGTSPAAPAAAPAAETPSTAQSPAAGDLSVLFSRIWRVTAAPSEPPLGGINIFLPNGTLLQTSCVETYQIAGWTIDKARPQVLQVSEDGQPTFTAEILELNDTTLRLRKQLIPTNETQEVTLTAAEDQFTCPDLPK